MSQIQQAEAIMDMDTGAWIVTLWINDRDRSVVRVSFDSAPDETTDDAENVARALWVDLPWRFERVQPAVES